MRHFALGSVLLLASAQFALAKDINVTVGGTSLVFDPPSVVCTSQLRGIKVLKSISDYRKWRLRTIHFQAKESLCHTINI